MPDQSAQLTQRLLTLFKGEARERISSIAASLQRFATGTPDGTVLETAFRDAHSLKAAAGVVPMSTPLPDVQDKPQATAPSQSTPATPAPPAPERPAVARLETVRLAAERLEMLLRQAEELLSDKMVARELAKRLAESVA